MYQSFAEYKQLKESSQFNEKVMHLCEAITKCELSFDEWWVQHGMPVILDSYRYDNEEELLMELMGGGGNFLGNMAGRATQGLQNLGRGLANGWQQGRQSVPVWQPQQGVMGNAQSGQPQGGVQSGQPQGVQSGQPQGNAQSGQQGGVQQPLTHQIQATQQQFVQKLKDLKAAAVQSKDQNSYKAVDQLIQALSGASRSSFAMGQGQKPQQPNSGMSSPGGNISSAQKTLAAAADAQRQGIGYMNRR